MKVFCWNVERRIDETLTWQLRAVLKREPDVVALQEVTPDSYPGWRDGLKREGFGLATTIDLLAEPYPPPPYATPPFPPGIKRRIKRTTFNLTAARHPMEQLPGLSFEDRNERRYAFPEKHLAVRVELDGTPVHVHNAHVPPGASRGLVKVHAYEAIRRRVDADAGVLVILCGDLNAPWSEDAEGAVRAVRRRWPDDLHERWLMAETALLAGRRLRDVYRDVHRSGTDFPVSHRTGRDGSLTDHRYDYVFASPELATEGCVYLSEWPDRNERGWRASDHAPVEAKLSLPSR
jgi:endonuclease/exonuclease/phosphatase family metal-dependent hydrolase